MARYNGKPKPKIKFRYTTELCGMDVYGVYDNKVNRFIVRDLPMSEANRITNKQADIELDKMMLNLIRRLA